MENALMNNISTQQKTRLRSVAKYLLLIFIGSVLRQLTDLTLGDPELYLIVIPVILVALL